MTKTKRLRPKAVPYDPTRNITRKALFFKIIEPSFVRQFRLMKKWFTNP